MHHVVVCSVGSPMLNELANSVGVFGVSGDEVLSFEPRVSTEYRHDLRLRALLICNVMHAEYACYCVNRNEGDPGKYLSAPFHSTRKQQLTTLTPTQAQECQAR
jgi:hypothetical protein